MAPNTTNKVSSSASSVQKEESASEQYAGGLPTSATGAVKAGSLWKNLKLGADEGNETQRGMKSRHLMMIGSHRAPRYEPCMENLDYRL